MRTKYKITKDNELASSFDLTSIQDFATKNNLSLDLIESEEVADEIIDAFQLAKAIEVERYFKRREDGIRMFLELMSELRLTSQANQLPRAWLRGLETAFAKVQSAVESGQWMTAKEECELISISGYVTEAIYNRIYNAIVNYISENYNES